MKTPENFEARLAATMVVQREMNSVMARIEVLQAKLDEVGESGVKQVLIATCEALKAALHSILEHAEQLDANLARTVLNAMGSSHNQIGGAVERSGLKNDEELCTASEELLILRDELLKYSVPWQIDRPWN